MLFLVSCSNHGLASNFLHVEQICILVCINLSYILRVLTSDFDLLFIGSIGLLICFTRPLELLNYLGCHVIMSVHNLREIFLTKVTRFLN